MKTFSLNTLGCKVNQYESQQIRELLERFGLDQVRNSQSEPDLVVINTCCVTHTASARSRQSIHKVQKLYPNAVTVVCGCLATVDLGELNCPGKNLLLIKSRTDLAVTLSQIVNGKTAISRQDSRIQQDSTIKAQNDSKIKSKSIDGPAKLSVLT